VAALIVLLGTERPLRNAGAFVAGWTAVLAALGAAAATLLPAPAAGARPGAGRGVAEVLVGAALLLLGAVQWRRRGRPAGGEPAWMARTRRAGPLAAFALGAFLPTYALVFPAVRAIERAQLAAWQAAVAYLGFLVLATAGLAVPIGVYALRPAGAATTLARHSKLVI
jgi:hypothetical protein